MKKTLLLFACAFIANFARTQCTGLTFNTSADTVPCGGGNVLIYAFDSSHFALSNDFNTGTAGVGWSVSPAGVFNNPCGTAPDGTNSPYMWMGNTTAAPRELATADLDLSLSCGADSVCFDLKFAEQGTAQPCEGPDLTNEGVYLEWSINGGTTWTTINYFQPNTSGSFNSASPGSGDYTAWANYCFAIPPAAITTATQFHWFQDGSSGTCCDHWGIDNVVISAANCNYYYDWAHLGGFPDTNIININVQTDTTLSVLYTNGVDDTCTGSINLYVDTTVDYTLNITSPTCNTSNNAVLEIIPTSGAPTYTYNLFSVAGPDTVGQYSPLAPGWYTFDITDGVSGCYTLDSVEILNGPPLSYNSVVTQPSCNTTMDGVITLNPTSGTAPYSYSITGFGTGPQTSNSFSPLAPGMYSFEIVDVDGCVANGTASVPIGPSIVVLVNGTTASTCPGADNGTVNLVGYGTPGYTFSINGPIITSSTSGLITGLPSGSYTVSITDTLGCLGNSSFTIGTGAGITASVTGTDELCDDADDGTINIASTGTSPFTYSISGPTSTGNSSGMFTGLPDGTYTVSVIDDNGCTDMQTFVVGQGLVLDGTAALTSASCSNTSDGAIIISPTNGQAPYFYTVNDGAGISLSDSVGSYNALPGGIYVYTIQDSNGCVFADTVAVGSPAPVVAGFNASPTAGIAPLDVIFTNTSTNATSYFWDFDNTSTSTATDPGHTFYADGNYSVMLVAQNGPCFDTAYLTIAVVNNSLLIVPNVITPNGDGLNDAFYPTHSGIESYNCTIFNRWGAEIYSNDNVNGVWDGTKNGNKVAEGTYFYVIVAQGIDGREYNLKGTINVFYNE